MPAALDRPNDPLSGKPPLTRFECAPAFVDRWGNQTSQFGEDGLVEAVFELIGTTNKWCFEVGAGDGLFWSNTLRLREAGWHAVLIEGNPVEAEKLKKFDSDRVCTCCAMAGELDCILLTASQAIPREPDFGVIDIDGQDWWVWYDLKLHVPRVMLVEYSPYRKTGHYGDEGEEFDVTEAYWPRRGGKGQAGIKPILELGHRKGYLEVAITPVNVLFVKEELLP
jgi:hypothetical protein